MGHHLHIMSYFLTIFNTQLLTALVLAATIATVTYVGTITTLTVFNKYHQWKNSKNSVMTFWEWTKSVLNIDKALAQIMKTRPKLKTKHKIRCNFFKRYYIRGKRGRHSQVATKRSHSPNLLPYFIGLTADNDTGHQASFYLESFIIGVNNHSSNTISNNRAHFIRNFHSLPHQYIKGISGQIAIKGQGTIRWNIEDEKDGVHTLYIKYALYVLESIISVLCPQHWYQHSQNNFPTYMGTYMDNFEGECVLYFNQIWYKRSFI